MARSYQVACPPGSVTTIASMVTLGGGARVTILNSHATEPLLVSGNENEVRDAGGAQGGSTLSATTGYRIAAGGTLSLVLDGNEAVYGKSATSTVTVTASVFRSNARI